MTNLEQNEALITQRPGAPAGKGKMMEIGAQDYTSFNLCIAKESHPAVETAKIEAILGDLNSDSAALEKATQAWVLGKGLEQLGAYT